MKKITLIGGGILVLLSGGMIFLAKTPSTEVELVGQNKKQEEIVLPTGPYVEVGATIIPVTIADDPAEVTKGLSGTTKLPDNEGMYFIFKNPDRYRFWMPDMNFPIDIIWIEGGKIVGIEPNVSNEFNPTNPAFYMPPVPVRNVLEVNDGFAAEHGFTVGMDVITHFPANE